MLQPMTLHDSMILHGYLTDPSVYPYVRYKEKEMDAYLFLMKRLMEEEKKGNMHLRVIRDEHAKPIGQIALFDVRENSGFLATWLGSPFHGKGYNRLAKEQFLEELFLHHDIERVYLKIRKENEKSKRATEKLPYTTSLEGTNPLLYHHINQGTVPYHVYGIEKEDFLAEVRTGKEA